MKGQHLPYSEAELAWVRAHCALSRAELHALFRARFGRADVSLSALTGLCKRKGWLTGRNGRFAPGGVPHNKGKPMPYNAASAAHQFRKGQLPHNTKWAGHERVSKQGYVEISVEETNPHTGYGRRYVLKHRWLWEKANGPVPEGYALKCLDGDRMNTDPSNWKPVPRSMLPRLGGRYGRDYDASPAELKPTILAVTELEDLAARRLKEG